MKKFILSVFLPLLYFLSSLLFPFAALSAKADSSALETVVGSYACVLNDNTYFYSSRDTKRGVFVLPKTYYVTILEVSPDFCKIEYLYDDSKVQRLVGYAKTSELTFVDYVPERPYLYYLFDVSYRLDETLSNDSGFLNQITVTCAYYGDYPIGSETYCYVLRDDSFGYIPKPTNLSYSENTEYADRLSQSVTAPADPSAPSENGSSPAQIAILVALCLLVPVLAALILKPPRRPPYETDE